MSGNHPQILNMDKLDLKLKKLSSSARAKLPDAAEAGGRVIEGYAKINANEKFSSHATNALANSITVEVQRNGAGVTALVGPTVEYGRIQELGGTVHPTRAKFLAIPATEMARKIGSPRSYPGKLRFVGDDNSGALVSESGETVYVLRKQVTLPAKPYLRPALDEHKPEIVDAVKAVIGNGILEVVHGG